ncbi:MAG: glycosyltransferase family 2 protein [Hyphomonas sp.]
MEHSGIPAGQSAPLLYPPADMLQADAAAEAFARTAPHLSARTTLTLAQRRWIVRALALAGSVSLAAPYLPVLAFMFLAPPVFAAIILFRLCLLLIARTGRRQMPEPETATPLLPVYTILVALKDEAAVMPQLSRAMALLDYPETSIDLKLLVEADDVATRDAIEAAHWPANTELVVVPPGRPQTKPRALNYGLARARGTYVVVYDAEDRPHPGQLKAAIDGFNRAGPETVCLQAPLVGMPVRGGWLARQWTQEYAIQFGLIVPALSRLGLPVALGGTSNHFRRAALAEAGGWDAWNVTEDADLGLRLARLGKRVGVIASPTLEAPPEEGRVWLAQRSRWLKGYVQTWCVLMRGAGSAGGGLRTGAQASVQLTLGAAILSAMVHGPWALWCAACLISPALKLGFMGSAALAASFATALLSASLAPGPRGWRRVADILTMPLYWPLQSLAMVRALWSLARTPH